MDSEGASKFTGNVFKLYEFIDNREMMFFWFF